MKKQLRDSWVKALRSGEYKQARETLQVGNAYCCLGVLCHVAGIEIPIEANDLDSFETYRGDDDEIVYDLRPFRDECGLGTGDGSPQNHLVDMNDKQLATFPVIASWIEANIPVEE